MQGFGAPGCLLREFAKGRGANATDDKPVGGITCSRFDLPAICCRSNQHGPSGGRRRAERLFERAHGRGIGSDPYARRPALVRCQRIGVGLGQRRGLDGDGLPRGAELVGNDLGQGCPNPLPSLDLRNRD